MALKGKKGAAPSKAAPAAGDVKRGPSPGPVAVEQRAAASAGAALVERAPSWLLGPIYGASLTLVFIGERIVSTDKLRMAISGLGVLGAVATTSLRFGQAGKAPAERRRAERTLALLSAAGLVALALYFSTTETARDLFGIAKAAPQTRARIEGATTVGYVALFLISLVPLVFGELALAPMRRAARVEARRVRAAIGAGFTLSFAAVYCALCTYAAGELEYKVDFSYYRTARPSESTRNIAASASEPIKVLAFFPDLNEVGAEVRGYLDELGQKAPNIKVEHYDRLLVPKIAKDAKVTQDGTVVLTRGESREVLNVGAEMTSARAKLKSLDGDSQKALLKVMRSARVAYMTVGHSEMNTVTGDAAEGRTARALRRLLESQNYTVKDLGLAQGLGTDIPEDATMVIVLGPAQAFLPEEVSSLSRYAERGGHLLLALDPEAKVDLAPLAEMVGVTWSPVTLASDRTFVRRRHNESDRAILVTNRFSSHASVSTLSRNSTRAPVIFPVASSLDKKQGANEAVDFAVKSLGETFNDDNGNFAFDKEGEKRGTYNLAAAVTRAASGKSDDKGKTEMRAFVVADVDVFSDAAFGNEPNIFFAVDVLRWLGGEESFSGAITTTEDVRIEHTRDKDKIWFYATIFGAPALLLGVGLVATRRSRSDKRGRAREKGE